jgi:hypothetical protein
MTNSLHTTVMSPGHYSTSQDTGKGRGNVVPVNAIKEYTETKGVALLILTLSAIWRWVVYITSRPLSPRERTPASTEQEAGWTVRTGLDVSKKKKTFVHAENGTTYRPAPGAVDTPTVARRTTLMYSRQISTKGQKYTSRALGRNVGILSWNFNCTKTVSKQHKRNARDYCAQRRVCPTVYTINWPSFLLP